jgi:hypothetical protein
MILFRNGALAEKLAFQYFVKIAVRAKTHEESILAQRAMQAWFLQRMKKFKETANRKYYTPLFIWFHGFPPWTEIATRSHLQME